VSQRRANANSTESTASAAGMTTVAGPGSTIMAIPMTSIVPPMIAIAMRRARRYA